VYHDFALILLLLFDIFTINYAKCPGGPISAHDLISGQIYVISMEFLCVNRRLLSPPNAAGGWSGERRLHSQAMDRLCGITVACLLVLSQMSLRFGTRGFPILQGSRGFPAQISRYISDPIIFQRFLKMAMTKTQKAATKVGTER